MYSPAWCYKNKSPRPMEDGAWRHCGIGTQHRYLGGWPSRSLLGATPPMSSLYNSCLLWVAYPLVEPWVSVWEQNPLCWPFKSAPGFLADALLFQVDRVPVDFHCQMLYGCLFPALILWDGDPRVELRLHSPQRRLLQPRYPSGFSAAACGCRGQPFLCLCPYQSLCDYFCKSLIIIFMFSCPSVGYSTDSVAILESPAAHFKMWKME